MATVRSLIGGFHSLLLLLLIHLGCCFSPVSNQDRDENPNPNQPTPKRRKISPLSLPSPTPAIPYLKPRQSLSLSIRFYLKHLFSLHKPDPRPQTETSTISLPPSHLQPLVSNAPSEIPSEKADSPADATKRSSFASRTDIFPCSACGEVFHKIHLLDLHQATKHALSELSDGDSGRNIVEIIFQSGWKGMGRGGEKIPTVHRILKIHNSSKTLARFEEYRDMVRSRAARLGGRRCDERCIADGNERLRFYCSSFLCSLERAGNLGTCGSQFCITCGIVRHGFSGKNVDGIATHATGWGAHVSLPEELEEEFAFMHVRRAMLVCRVVAGRVALGGGVAKDAEEEGVYDSVVVGTSGGAGVAGDEELLVFNSWAVLPCFVILYSVC